MRLSDVEITVLLQPDHRPQAQRHIDAAKAGLKYYGLRYGRYPYKTLTVVDPAPGASGAGGMEYPTFITAGTAWLLNAWPFDKIRMVEFVTIHEFGHQFWYAMVGNNEFEEAWLDEGINTYSTSKSMVAAYGAEKTVIDFLGIAMGDQDMSRTANDATARYNRVLARAWEYTPRGAYSFYSYYKPSLVLQTLEGYVGEQTMARILRTYHERWRFKHPRSEDFFAVVNEVTGQDWGWYFDQVVRGTDIVDYDIGSATTDPIPTARGVFDGPGGRKTVSSERGQEGGRRGCPGQEDNGTGPSSWSGGPAACGCRSRWRSSSRASPSSAGRGTGAIRRRRSCSNGPSGSSGWTSTRTARSCST